MLVKFIQYWDVLSGKGEEFDTFLVQNYIPGINESGLVKIVRSAYAIAGEGPYFILEGVSDSLKNVNQLLKDEEFNKLKRLLLFLITGYKTTVLVSTNRFGNKIPGTLLNCQFNQHYDLVYDKYEEYIDFITGEHIPILNKLGIDISGEWEVCIGAGPNLIIEGQCQSTKQLFKALEGEEYKRSTVSLLNLVKGYGSKILIPTGHIK